MFKEVAFQFKNTIQLWLLILLIFSTTTGIAQTARMTGTIPNYTPELGTNLFVSLGYFADETTTNPVTFIHLLEIEATDNQGKFDFALPNPTISEAWYDALPFIDCTNAMNKDILGEVAAIIHLTNGTNPTPKDISGILTLTTATDVGQYLKMNTVNQYWVYINQDSNISVTCKNLRDGTQGEWQFNVNLKSGWNQIQIKISDTRANDGYPIKAQVTTGAVTGAKWLFVPISN
jgi:hypothetical protein